MRAYIHFRAYRRADNLKHIANPVPYTFADSSDIIGNVFDGEQFFRINLPVPGVLVIDAGEKAFPYLQSGIFPAYYLEKEVMIVDILNRGGAFNFDDIPFIIIHRIQGICHEPPS